MQKFAYVQITQNKRGIKIEQWLLLPFSLQFFVTLRKSLIENIGKIIELYLYKWIYVMSPSTGVLRSHNVSSSQLVW